MTISKILRDILTLNGMLGIYRFTASRKDEIIPDLKSVKDKLDEDVKKLKEDSCTSKKQREEENKDIVTLSIQIKNTLATLQELKTNDSGSKEFFESIENSIKDFETSLNDYRNNSEFTVYNLDEVRNFSK